MTLQAKRGFLPAVPILPDLPISNEIRLVLQPDRIKMTARLSYLCAMQQPLLLVMGLDVPISLELVEKCGLVEGLAARGSRAHITPASTITAANYSKLNWIEKYSNGLYYTRLCPDRRRKGIFLLVDSALTSIGSSQNPNSSVREVWMPKYLLLRAPSV